LTKKSSKFSSGFSLKNTHARNSILSAKKLASDNLKAFLVSQSAAAKLALYPNNGGSQQYCTNDSAPNKAATLEHCLVHIK